MTQTRTRTSFQLSFFERLCHCRIQVNSERAHCSFVPFFTPAEGISRDSICCVAYLNREERAPYRSQGRIQEKVSGGGGLLLIFSACSLSNVTILIIFIFPCGCFRDRALRGGWGVAPSADSLTSPGATQLMNVNQGASSRGWLTQLRCPAYFSPFAENSAPTVEWSTSQWRESTVRGRC